MLKLKFDLFDKTIIFLLLIGIFIIGFMLFRTSTMVEVTVKLDQNEGFVAPWIDQIGTRPSISSLIKVGMIGKDGFGKPQAEITNVKLYEIFPEKHHVYVNIRLKSTYSKSQNSYSYKGRPLAIGEPITVNLERITLKGIIVNTPDIRTNQIPKKLRIYTKLIVNDPVYPNTSGVDPFIAQALKIGDQVLDYNNQPIARIIDLKSKPALTLTTNNNGVIVSSQNPKKLDVDLVLEINGYELGGKYFFLDELPVMVGRSIPLNFPYISIYPTITVIELVES